MTDLLKFTKQLHGGYIEEQEARKSHPEIFEQVTALAGMFGKWQYLFETERGTISLISLPTLYQRQPWEIYSFGTYFEDIERYATRDGAYRRIIEVLDLDGLIKDARYRLRHGVAGKAQRRKAVRRRLRDFLAVVKEMNAEMSR